ncbi:regulatory protein RecX [Aliikangiella coralliicola]|uniref:Regulatory protein RecX n=1 Tax=Aliikangiella coralliicola TaxID=2592383 RepID=A0A545TWA5_9GAMM|nr:regulatory protein RecX [Aliikangiella coralliicola]TQV81506.1 regulatory protein RecX [Aliikangiella coralliicola]
MNEPQTVPDPKRVNKAIAYAARLLGVREYARRTLNQKLLTKGYTEEEADEVMAYLVQHNWISDERFCESFVRSKAARGQGLTRIRAELYQHGIEQSLIDEVVELQDICWQQLCDETAAKKAVVVGISNEPRSRAKLERFLRYRGFSSEQIVHSINKCINNVGVMSGEYDQ